MSNKMITAAWDVPLPAHARLVLIALADSASDDEGVCWISNKTIMQKSTCAKTTLGYILFAFERLGIILRETRFRPENGSQTSSLKRIVVPLFNGSKEEVEAAKNEFAKRYEEAYLLARKKKDTPSHHVTWGEGSQGDLPPVTQCDPLYEPSFEPSESEEEEEVGICEVEIVATSSLPPLVIPMAMGHLPISLIEQAIDKAVAKLARRSPAGYRRRLLEGLAAGDAGWIETVSEFVKQVEGYSYSEAPWQREKRLKREEGEAISVGFREAGFGNIFDYLESRGGEA